MPYITVASTIRPAEKEAFPPTPTFIISMLTLTSNAGARFKLQWKIWVEVVISVKMVELVKLGLGGFTLFLSPLISC